MSVHPLSAPLWQSFPDACNRAAPPAPLELLGFELELLPHGAGLHLQKAF